jgi:hypothetical protein
MDVSMNAANTPREPSLPVVPVSFLAVKDFLP